MPTYDYECPKCGHQFEKFQGINDPPAKTCPQCRGRKVKRLIGTGAGILFKGSGFFATDYRSEGYKKAARSDSGGSGSAGSTGSSDKGAGGDGGKTGAKETKTPAKSPAKKESS